MDVDGHNAGPMLIVTLVEPTFPWLSVALSLIVWFPSDVLAASFLSNDCVPVPSGLRVPSKYHWSPVTIDSCSPSVALPS